MSKLWLPGTDKVPDAQSGGTMLGGNSLCTHHITVSPRGSFAGTRDYLVAKGYEPHLLLDAYDGNRCQFLPANRSGYALEHTTAETNREGTVNIQIEWLWPKMSADITKAPHFAEIWAELIPWLDDLGVPRTWPFGFTSTSRSPTTWRKGGHRGHINAPGNSHVDNLPAASPPAWPKTANPLTDARRAAAVDLAKHLDRRTHPLVPGDRRLVRDLRAAAAKALDR